MVGGSFGPPELNKSLSFASGFAVKHLPGAGRRTLPPSLLLSSVPAPSRLAQPPNQNKTSKGRAAVCKPGRWQRSRERLLPCAGRHRAGGQLAPLHAPMHREVPALLGLAGLGWLLVPGGRALGSASCEPARSAAAPVCHVGQSVGSTTRRGAGPQLSRDCSAPWRANDGSQRLSASPGKPRGAG